MTPPGLAEFHPRFTNPSRSASRSQPPHRSDVTAEAWHAPSRRSRRSAPSLPRSPRRSSTTFVLPPSCCSWRGMAWSGSRLLPRARRIFSIRREFAAGSAVGSLVQRNDCHAPGCSTALTPTRLGWEPRRTVVLASAVACTRERMQARRDGGIEVSADCRPSLVGVSDATRRRRTSPCHRRSPHPLR